MSSDEKDPEMICALTADEHVALQRGLRSLPLTMPPRKVWLRIKEQAEAEGLFTQPAPRTHKRWYAGVGLAAAALMAAVMMPGGHKAIDPRDVVPQGETSNPNDLSNLRASPPCQREQREAHPAVSANHAQARATALATP